MTAQTRRIELTLFILILVIGAGLRFAALGSVPPGLTHDEADHGLDAAGVLAGRTPIYFTVGYGREPLYDYVTSVTMLIVGRNYLASRITAAIFGTVLLVLIYAWVRRATHNPWLALAAMAGLAFSFWGVSTGRQALRSITLPVMYMAAAEAMWQGIKMDEDIERLPPKQRPQAEIERLFWFAIAGIFLGLSLYTYLAARIMWAVFPAFFIFLSFSQRGTMRRIWPGLLIMLAVAAVIAAPLGIYLYLNPVAEVRIDQLSGPIDALLAGHPGSLIENTRAGLGMITKRGDDLWLYNIPGKPLLGPIMSLFFYLGVSIAVMSLFYPYRPARRGKRTFDDAFRMSSANAFMLLTLAAGMIPALITGVGASNTRVIGMQPALYYFPALAVMWLSDWSRRRVGSNGPTAIWTGFSILLLINVGLTIRDYFNVWANARDVRVAYHTTLVETLHYLDNHPEVGPDVGMSTITPGRFHDPAVAEMVLKRDDLNLHWFDGRLSLVIPGGKSVTYVYPEVAARRSRISPYDDDLEFQRRIELRSTDFNRTVELFSLPALDIPSPQESGKTFVVAGDELLAISLEGYLPSTLKPGDNIPVSLIVWVNQPTDQVIVLFTHALDQSNQVVAQQDLLSVPSWNWAAGDVFWQLHHLTIPAGHPPGTLRIAIGAYTTPDIERLPLTDSEGQPLPDNQWIALTIEILAP
jgi:hypothetical protein